MKNDNNNINRIVFYSKTDGALYPTLEKIDTYLSKFDLKESFGINDYLEFHHIDLHFSKELFHPTWDKEKVDKYKEINKKLVQLTKTYFLQIEPDKISSLLEETNFNYKESFWKLISKYQLHERINKDQFIQIVKNNPRQISNILKFKNIVQRFGTQIKNFLLEYENSSELILRQFAERKSESSSLYFPQQLTLKDKEQILLNYLNLENCNLNYVRLILNIKNSSSLKISNKTRLKAKKVASKLNEEILTEGAVSSTRFQVSLSETQEEPVKYLREENNFTASYSLGYLDSLKNNKQLFDVFSNLFGYVDYSNLISLVSKEAELNVFENLSVRSKDEYITGIVFSKKDAISLYQLLILNEYLKDNRKSSIEDTVKNYISEEFTKLFDGALRFRFPKLDSSDLEKIRVLVPDFEFLIKQFNSFVEEGSIDFELLEMESSPLNFSSIKSQAKIKYCYSDNKELSNLIYYFFSDQSPIHYLEPYGVKYNSFYGLILNENIQLEDFYNYQKPIIKDLIKNNYLLIDSNGFVKLKKSIFIFIAGEINHNGVISYWHYPDYIRKVIDQMISEKYLFTEQTLLSRKEQEYFSFYLNKKRFTNGLDLRNKYLHGTNTDAEETHHKDYIILLRLLILLIIKINDDFFVKEREEQTGANNG